MSLIRRITKEVLLSPIRVIEGAVDAMTYVVDSDRWVKGAESGRRPLPPKGQRVPGVPLPGEKVE